MYDDYTFWTYQGPGCASADLGSGDDRGEAVFFSLWTAGFECLLCWFGALETVLRGESFICPLKLPEDTHSLGLRFESYSHFVSTQLAGSVSFLLRGFPVPL